MVGSEIGVEYEEGQVASQSRRVNVKPSQSSTQSGIIFSASQYIPDWKLSQWMLHLLVSLPLIVIAIASSLTGDVEVARVKNPAYQGEEQTCDRELIKTAVTSPEEISLTGISELKTACINQQIQAITIAEAQRFYSWATRFAQQEDHACYERTVSECLRILQLERNRLLVLAAESGSLDAYQKALWQIGAIDLALAGQLMERPLYPQTIAALASLQQEKRQSADTVEREIAVFMDGTVVGEW